MSEISTFSFDRERIRSALLNKPALQVVAFATACSGRLLNSLVSTVSDSEAVQVARDSFDMLVDYVTRDAKFNVEQAERRLLSLIPDEDEIVAGDTEVALLDDTLAALAYSVRSIISDSPDNGIWSAQRAYDAVDFFVSASINAEIYTDSSEVMVASHPIVQQELIRQERDLREIEALPSNMEIAQAIVSRSMSEAIFRIA